MSLAATVPVLRRPIAIAQQTLWPLAVVLAQVLMGILFSPPRAIRAQATQEDTTPLFVIVWPGGVHFDHKAITRRFPEMAGFEFLTTQCRFVALVSDTTVAPRIHEAFLPVVSRLDGGSCPGKVDIRPFPYSHPELQEFTSHISSLLVGSNTGGVPYFDARYRKLLVTVNDEASVARAESRIRPDTTLPQDLIEVRVLEPRQLAAVPQDPPAEAYVPVLVHLYREWTRSRDPKPTLGLLPHNLPEGFAERHLSGLDIVLTDDRCSVDRAISLFPPHQLLNGGYVITVLDGSQSIVFDVLCDGNECFLTRVMIPMVLYGGFAC